MRVPELPFKLEDIEAQSALWQKLEAYARKRLASARRRNDHRKLDPIDTAALRGEIAELKHFIGLGQNPMPEDTAD